MKDATWRSPNPTIVSLYDFYTAFYVFLSFQQFVDLGSFEKKKNWRDQCNTDEL